MSVVCHCGMCSGEATRASRTSAGGTPPQEETLALRTVGVGRQRQCRTHPTDGRNSGEDPCVSPLWAPNRPSPHEHSLGARRQDWVASKCSHAPQVGRDQGKPECNLKNNPMAYRRGGSPRRLSSLAWVTGRGPRVTGASPAWSHRPLAACGRSEALSQTSKAMLPCQH